MKKILTISAILAALTMSANAGELHKNIALGVGSEEIGTVSNASYQLTGGSKYFFSTGIVLGGDIGVGYTKIGSENLPSFDGNVKLGYSFGGETGKGLGVYGLYGFTLGATKTYRTDINGNLKSDTSRVQGDGVGAQVEYVFDNGWTVGAIYQTYSMEVDTVGVNPTYDATNITARIGYSW